MTNSTQSKFNRLLQLYNNNKFDELFGDAESTYWLKLRSISRKNLMLEFSKTVNLDPSGLKGIDLFKFIYDSHPSEEQLNKFIKQKHDSQRSLRKAIEDRIVSELFKLQSFDWGGLYQNNLEKTIVDNYVKKITDFEELTDAIENQISASVRSYVYTSWYNHWTSILIEDIFKDHSRVLPTVGQVKKIDFFIDDVPFDLKVTYFPDGFMKVLRDSREYKPELTELKSVARKEGIKYDKKAKPKSLFAELITRFRESSNEDISRFFSEFRSRRKTMIRETISNSQQLKVWLYENQGERRFDAANRLFVILIDEENLEDSWKMKRNFELLRKSISEYLNTLDLTNLPTLTTKFTWQEEEYSAYSDCLFITK